MQFRTEVLRSEKGFVDASGLQMKDTEVKIKRG